MTCNECYRVKRKCVSVPGHHQCARCFLRDIQCTPRVSQQGRRTDLNAANSSCPVAQSEALAGGGRHLPSIEPVEGCCSNYYDALSEEEISGEFDAISESSDDSDASWNEGAHLHCGLDFVDHSSKQEFSIIHEKETTRLETQCNGSRSLYVVTETNALQEIIIDYRIALSLSGLWIVFCFLPFLLNVS